LAEYMEPWKCRDGSYDENSNKTDEWFHALIKPVLSFDIHVCWEHQSKERIQPINYMFETTPHLIRVYISILSRSHMKN